MKGVTTVSAVEYLPFRCGDAEGLLCDQLKKLLALRIAVYCIVWYSLSWNRWKDTRFIHLRVVTGGIGSKETGSVKWNPEVENLPRSEPAILPSNWDTTLHWTPLHYQQQEPSWYFTVWTSHEVCAIEIFGLILMCISLFGQDALCAWIFVLDGTKSTAVYKLPSVQVSPTPS
jgi:hypothetical protein